MIGDPSYKGPGKPILLGTTQRFMEYFGLKSIADLPKLKEFAVPDQEIGEPAPIEVDAKIPEEPIVVVTSDSSEE